MVGGLLLLHYTFVRSIDALYTESVQAVMKIWICVVLFCGANVAKALIARILSRNFQVGSLH